MSKKGNVTFLAFTATEGRYYVDHKWVGNYYIDTNGNRRDTKNGRIL
jgi:hypothetical protein